MADIIIDCDPLADGALPVGLVNVSGVFGASATGAVSGKGLRATGGPNTFCLFTSMVPQADQEITYSFLLDEISITKEYLPAMLRANLSATDGYSIGIMAGGGGNVKVHVFRWNSGTPTEKDAAGGGVYDIGTVFDIGDVLNVRFQISGSGATVTIRYRVWVQGHSEPGTWLNTILDTDAGRIVAAGYTGFRRGGADVTGDNITLVGITPGAPPGAPYTRVDDVLSNGKTISLAVPSGYDAGVPTRVVLFFRGRGQTADSIFTDSLLAGTLNALVTDTPHGYIVVCGETDLWGVDGSVTTGTLMEAYVRAHYNVKEVYILAMSAGGPGAMRCIYEGAFSARVIALKGIYPVCDQRQVPSLSSEIVAAFGVATVGDIPVAKIPVTRPASAYSPHCIAYDCISSPGDTVVPEIGNSIPFIALLNGAPGIGIASNPKHTGDHGDLTAFDPTALLAFYAAAAALTPDNTAPTVSGTPVINSTGDTLTVVLSEPCLPASGISGFALPGHTLGAGVQTDSTHLTFAISSPVVDQGETVTLSATGSNVTDLFWNPLANFSGHAVTNNSTHPSPGNHYRPDQATMDALVDQLRGIKKQGLKVAGVGHSERALAARLDQIIASIKTALGVAS